MVSDAKRDRYDEVVAEAQKRWKGRQREVAAARRNADKQAWTKLDTPERLIQRVERLGAALAAASGIPEPSAEEAMALALLADTDDSSAVAEVSEEAMQVARKKATDLRDDPQTLDDQMFERILGSSRDLLSIEFFEQGLWAAASVGLVSTDGSENGTGFLVGPNVMMTNWHVLETAEMAARSDLTLDFEANRFGPHKNVQIFPCNPKALFVANPELDYALVAISPNAIQGAKLADYGFLPLIGRMGKAVAGEYVNIVQHPGGKAKQICVRNNRILDLPGTAPKPGAAELDPFLLYEADTERGSSGSPVCNDQWEVVALHHAALPKNAVAGKAKGEGRGGDGEWIANEGIRTSRVVASLRLIREGLEPEHRSHLDELLTLWSGEEAPTNSNVVARKNLQESIRSTGRPHTDLRAVIGGQFEIEIPLRLKIDVDLADRIVTRAETSSPFGNRARKPS
ncbi:MAG: serine protease [Pseudomonadota bacterium]